MPSEVVKQGGALMPEIMESVLLAGDLAKLTPQDRVRFYGSVCTSVGLNPLTKPFEYISLNGKLTLYAMKTCTDQLRSIHKVSVEDLQESEREGVFIVTAKVRNAEGRTDMAKGAVSIQGLKGEALSNALMKCETKAKRRATLSICGLGMLDETEVETIPTARKAYIDQDNGEILPPPETPPMQPHQKPTDKPRSKNYQMMSAFSAIHKEIGDEAYYRVLGVNGYEHCDQITNDAKAREIYREMRQILEEKGTAEREPGDE